MCILKFFTILSTFTSSSLASTDTFELVGLFVIFRHGDRTPTELESYPTDPYYRYDYYPIGRGELTNRGKQRAYQLGEMLKYRYNVTGYYRPPNVYARSTDVDRTKMSLQLVMAGLWPPTGVQRWNSELNWQPVSTTYTNKESLYLLDSMDCPTYEREIRLAEESAKFNQEQSQFQDLMETISHYTGENITSTNQLYSIYHTLNAEVSLNLILPEWTKSYYPNGQLRDATLFQYYNFNYNDILRRLSGGMVVRQTIDNMVAIMNGEKVPKYYLYSAHESNVAAVLFTLKAWKPVVPQFSSAVILELLKKDGRYYIKVVYYSGIPGIFEVRTIDGCTEYCLFETAVNILQNVLPHNMTEECYNQNTVDEIKKSILHINT